MWKVSWFYEKVQNIVNFGGYAAILSIKFGANPMNSSGFMTNYSRETISIFVVTPTGYTASWNKLKITLWIHQPL